MKRQNEIMSKDYKRWHELKSKIEGDNKLPLFHEREIWWCSVGNNVGIEIDGKNELFNRPVLVYRKFNREMFLGFPLTASKKSGPFYFSFDLLEKERAVVLSQIRVWSGKRLTHRLGKVSDKIFNNLDEAFVKFLQKGKDPRKGGLSSA